MKKVFMLVLLSFFMVSCVSVTKKCSVPSADTLQINVSNNSSAAIAGGFITLQSTWAKSQTEVRVKTTSKGMRFEFFCYGDPAKMIYSPKKADDDMTLFGNDHIELQLAPDWQKSKKYYHFAVNAANSVYHAIGHDTSWTPKDFSCSSTDFKDYRKIVIEITWQTLGLSGKPADGTVWKANFCRTAKIKDSVVETSSWSGAQSFHDFHQMGELVFSDSERSCLQVFKCAINNNILESAVALATKGEYLFQIRYNNQIVCEKTLSNSDVFNSRITLQKNYIPLKNRDRIVLRLSRNGVVVWEKSSCILNTGKEFMSLDKFEYLKPAEMKCEVSLLPGTITIKNDSKILLKQDVSASPAIVQLKDLPAGRYVVEYASGNNSSSRVFFVTDKVPAQAVPLEKNAKMTIRGTELLRGDVPFYLLGISGGSKTYFTYDPGFNLCYGRGFRKNALEFQVFPGKRLIRKPFTSYAFNHDWEQQISQYLARQKKYRADNWRSLCYEANLKVSFRGKDGSLTTPEDGYKIYGKIYAMAKKAMPDSIFSIHVDNMETLPRYVNFCDVLEFASWRSSYHRSDMIWHFADDFDYVRGIVGDKPVVMWLGGSIPTADCRSEEELRAGVYHTIISGGVGNIIHMGHGGIPARRTRFWSMLSRLQREVDSFYVELKNGKSYNLELPSDFVGKAVVAAPQELLLVILNKTANEQILTLDLPDYDSGTFVFTPYEPRVIRLRKK